MNQSDRHNFPVVEQAERIRRSLFVVLLATGLAAFCACQSAIAANVEGDGTARQAQIRQAALRAAEQHHGLPPGVSVPAWLTKPGVHAYLAPTPLQLRQSAKGARKLGVGRKRNEPMNPGEGPRSLRERHPTAPVNDLGLRCQSGYCPVPPLRYLGGVVQHQPKVHLVFWGSNWNSHSSDRAKILELFEALNGSAYQGVLTQYFDATSRVSGSITVDSFTDTRVSAPTKVGYGSMAPEVAYAIEQKAGSGWAREPDSQFILLTATGTSYESGFGEFCAYHDHDSQKGVYSIVPWAGDAPFGTTDYCDDYYGGGSALKATSLMASHEYAESATDPFYDTAPGWMDLEGYELSDLCSTPYDEIPGTKQNSTVYVQGQYDDHQNACSLSDSAPPQVLALTETATGVTRHTATINATVNPESSATTYNFEYGTTKSYGTTVPAKGAEAWPSAGSGRANVQVHQDLTGLTTDQLYHYRVVAKNASGITYGEDRTFLPSIWTSRPQAEPTGNGHSWMNDVDCPSASICVAVGRYHFNFDDLPLVYVGSQSHWTWQAMPKPAKGQGSFQELAGVSCESVNSCTAVGYGGNTTGIVPRAVHWNGTSWSLQSVPVPAGSTYAELTKVSCVAGQCMAVGDYKNSEGIFIDYSALWNGTTWSTVSTPNPSEAYEQSLLEDVSCVSPTFCEAVGWFNSPTGPAGAYRIILQWNGSKWTLQTPANSARTLGSVECVSTTFCFAVGEEPSVVERWNGSTWAAQASANLKDPSGDTEGGLLFGISCVSSSNCTAVGGGFSKLNGNAFTLAENWNGTTWTIQKTPRDSEQTFNELYAVSCVTSGRCAAVGGSNASATWVPLIETRATVAKYETSFGSSGKENGQLSQPYAMTVDLEGYRWVVDHNNNRVQEFNLSGGYMRQVGSLGSGNGQFKGPNGIAVTAKGNLLVTDGGNGRVEEFDEYGKYLGQFGSYGTGVGKLVNPWGIAVAADGSIWVVDAGYFRVAHYTSTGEYLGMIGHYGLWGSGDGEFIGPKGVAIGKDGHLWVADSSVNRVQEFNAQGEYLSQFGKTGTGDGQFEEAQGLAITPSGSILVADRLGGRVQQFAPNGEFETQFGSYGSGAGQMREPRGVAVGLSGAIYVSDTANDRVQEWYEPAVPKVWAGWAREVGATAATVEGTVNPNGVPATYHFEYDTVEYKAGDGPHGLKSPTPDFEVGSGRGLYGFDYQLTGLQANTTYHYRLVATNEEGPSYGEDKTFTTLPLGSQLSFSWEQGVTGGFWSTEFAGPTFESENGTRVECENGTGSGYLSSPEGGGVNLIFNKCREQASVFKFSCTSAGMATGQIAMKPLNAALVYLDAARTAWGMKLSPVTAGGPIAEFSCPGWGTYTWSGSLLAQITSPGLNEMTTTFSLTPQKGISGYTQKYEQIEGVGTKYYMSEVFNKGTPHHVSMTDWITFALERKGKFIP